MANTVIALKKSATPTATPTNLANGELAINYADGILYYKAANGAIASIQSLEGNSFGTVNANNTLVVADSPGSIFSLVSGNNITIVGDAVNDKITIGLADSVGIGTSVPAANLHVVGSVITGKLQHSPVPISKLLTGFDGADSDSFGTGVSLSSDGSILAVGSVNWEGTTGTGRGGVYIYDWNGSSWVQRGSVLEAADAADSDAFGRFSISRNNSILVVGTIGWEGATGSNRGAVYTYTLTGALPSSSGVSTGSGWIEGANSAIIGRTAGLDRITIDASGNVGIGVTSPSSALDVNGKITTRFGGALRGYFGAPSWDTSYISMQHALLTESASNAAIHQSSSGDTTVNAAVGRSLLLKINNDSGGQGQLEFTSKKFVFSGSNVAIGMTAPTAKFTVADGTSPTSQHIYGTYTDVSNYERLSLSANSSGNYIIGQQAGTGSARPLYLGANNATMVTVAASGNVGIGTTSPATILDVDLGGSSIRTKIVGSNPRGLINYIGTNGGDAYARAFYLGQNGLFSGHVNQTFTRDETYTGAWGLSMVSGGTPYETSSEFKIVYQAMDGITYSRLHIGSSGNVGIGITSPTSLLHVNGTANIVSTLTVLNMNVVPTIQAAFDKANAANVLAFNALPNTSGVSFNGNLNFPTGNVGIGTASPTAKLTVANGTSATSAHIYGTYTDVSNYERLNLTANSSGHYIIGQKAGTGSARPLYLGANNATAVTIDTAGNLGVGTTSPTYFGAGYTTLTTLGSSAAVIEARGASASNLRLQADNAYGMVDMNSNHPLLFRTNATERMRIASDGNVGVGTGSPAGRLDVAGNNVSIFLRSNDTNDSTLRYYVNSVEVATARGKTGNIYVIETGGTERMRIDSAGNVGIGNTPSAKLSISDSAAPKINFLVGTVERAFISYTESTSITRIDSDAILTFCTNNTEYVRIDSFGNVGIGTTTPGYKLEVAGSFAAQTKSFVINHQSKPNHKLRHGSLEGPENGVYVRGRTKTNVIELPEYWTWLVDDESITVTLTPIGTHQNLYVEKIEDNKVYIAGEANINCFYMINAERKDVDKLIVEY